ncbi:hypothetical protein IMSAGC007_01376 [Lachnospiraceae bacterium]|uniref:hypothetical protein n=1 Tax=Candidatus Merdisoma sp. JLR.KK011 TaxID=3114299 RepID=UPI0014352F5A|nr:hypothetical protein IMSAGC007_01376 [Lachnospiraceae bacterium]
MDMELKKYLYKAASMIAASQDSLFKVPVKKQKEFIESLKEPKDLIERSYNQYKCQRWLKSWRVNIVTDIGSILLLFYYYYLKKEEKILNTEHFNGIYLGMDVTSKFIPKELRDIYANIKNISRTGECLSKNDKKIIKELLRRYPLSFEFILKCLIKVRMYSWIINVYSPDAIIVSGEYSYTSSFLTYYCRKNNIKHINIMHGEKLFYIRDSFFKFDKCYVWAPYYINLFKRLKAEPNQFVVAVPPALILKGTYNKKYDYTYYLGEETEENLVKILQILMKLKTMGYKVAVRPHPIYSKMILIDKIFNQKIEIENPKETQIKESVLQTQNVISLYSTVINQAVNSEINAIIDDVSDMGRYKLLYELEYRFVVDSRVSLVSKLIAQ